MKHQKSSPKHKVAVFLACIVAVSHVGLASKDPMGIVISELAIGEDR